MEDREKRTKRAKFTAGEDSKLLRLVERYGDTDWRSISSLMKNRSVRQCRERWKNYLCPWVKTGPWAPEEDANLARMVAQYGTHWVKIAKFFPGRTDINVKNHWTILSKQRSEMNRGDSHDAEKKAAPEKEAPKEACKAGAAGASKDAPERSEEDVMWGAGEDGMTACGRGQMQQIWEML